MYDSLLTKAIANFNSTKVLIKIVDDDPNQLNIIAFHLSQATELAIKFELEMNGIEYPKTHRIDQLIRIAKESNVKLFVNEYIEDHAEMLSQWEADSRYILGFQAEKQKIEKAQINIESYLFDLTQRY